MTQPAANVQSLPVDQIQPSPDNLRGDDLGDLAELTELIKAQGVLQHLVVCPQVDGRYPLVFGHRRLAAAKQAGLTQVPAEIRDYTEAERFAAMYGENFGREGLTPIQEARAYQKALERTDGKGKKLFTQRSLAQRLGVGQAKISNYTGIFKLPAHVVAMLEQDELTITEAVLLVRLAKYPARVEAALADWREQPHTDMDLAVRTQQADLDREAKVEQTRRELEAAGVRLAPDDWREAGGRRLGDGYHELRVTPEEHQGEPCHAAVVTHHGEVAYVCTDPDRHQPAEEPAADPTPATATSADAKATQPGPAEAAPATQPAAETEPEAPAWPALAVVPAPPEPTEEELEAKRRMDAAREAAERERQERERLARERTEQLQAAYQARTAAMQTLLEGRLSRPEATRLLAWFLVRLAYQDYQYDETFVRSLLGVDDEAVSDGHDVAESPVLALAGKNDDGLLRVAVAIVAENAEEQLAAADEPDFTSPIIALYYHFLRKAAAYKPSEFELKELDPAAADTSEKASTAP